MISENVLLFILQDNSKHNDHNYNHYNDDDNDNNVSAVTMIVYNLESLV